MPVNVSNDKETVAINTAAITFRQYSDIFCKRFAMWEYRREKTIGAVWIGRDLFIIIYFQSSFSLRYLQIDYLCCSYMRGNGGYKPWHDQTN